MEGRCGELEEGEEGGIVDSVEGGGGDKGEGLDVGEGGEGGGVGFGVGGGGGGDGGLFWRRKGWGRHGLENAGWVEKDMFVIEIRSVRDQVRT